MSRDRRTPPTAKAADGADLATLRPGARAPGAETAKSDLHHKTPMREPAGPVGQADDAYWQRVIDRATD